MDRSFSFTRPDDVTDKNIERCFNDHDNEIRALLERMSALEAEVAALKARIDAPGGG